MVFMAAILETNVDALKLYLNLFLYCYIMVLQYIKHNCDILTTTKITFKNCTIFYIKDNICIISSDNIRHMSKKVKYLNSPQEIEKTEYHS